MAPPVVEISCGILRGREWEIVNGEVVFAFLGIPYGRPPIGGLRFKAPLPAEPWEGIRDATQDGSPCFGRDLFTQKLTGSEDCLFLNVYTKSLTTEKLRPVLVFIHGGAFVAGSNASDVHNPDFLLTEDIVLVAINYRLGMLGFLALDDPHLGVPGNAGMKDQVLALKWVRHNIQRFGGDPNNVTICGESAGSAAVHYLVLSPNAKGLFHKAILQSGSVHNPWPYGTAKLLDVLAVSHIKAKDEECALQYVMMLTPEELFQIQEAYLHHKRSMLRIFGPVVEKPNPTAFLTEEPVDIISSGNYNQVPMLIGYCDKESLLFDGEDYKLWVGATKDWNPTLEEEIGIFLGMDRKSELLKAVVNKIEKLYIASGMKHGKLLLISDLLFIAGIIASANLHADTSQAPVYLYRFSIETSLNLYKILCNQPGVQGACHADDLGYLFRPQLPNGSKFILEKGSIEETAVNRMVKLWTNFARYSDPTPTEEDIGIKWIPIGKNSPYFLDINKTLTLESDPEGERILIWNEVQQLYKSRGVKISGS